jgi:hypothetical protein
MIIVIMRSPGEALIQFDYTGRDQECALTEAQPHEEARRRLPDAQTLRTLLWDLP